MPKRTPTRSRRDPAVDPPDPSLSYPIPQHLDAPLSGACIERRFLIEGDKGSDRERHLVVFPESHSSNDPKEAIARDRGSTKGPKYTYVRANP